jgi:HTH-type transcriptional regulator / antitoxin HipB
MSSNQDTTEVVVHGPAQIGHAIRRYREVRGFDQAELAAIADVHRSYVSKTENSTPTETLSKVMRMLRALDLELVIRPRGRLDG